MKQQTINNIIDNMILNALKENYYIESVDILKMFEPLCDNSEDFNEILDIIENSKRYNYIICQDGKSYIFGTKEKDIKYFIKDVDICDYDLCWNSIVYCVDDSIHNQLYQFTDEYQKSILEGDF